MSDYLCLRLTETEIQPYTVIAWTVLTSTGQIVESGYSMLDQLASEMDRHLSAPGRIGRTIVIVPSSSALLTDVELPAKQRRHIRQILPFVVEDQIIDPVETMHLATPVLVDGETIPVAAIARRTIASWLDQLGEAGVSPDYLFLDASCVPNKTGQWQVLLDNQSVLFRSGRHRGTRVDDSMIDTVLHLALTREAARQQGSDDTETDMPNVQEDTGPLVNIVVASETDRPNYLQVLRESQRRQEATDSGSGVALDEFSQKPERHADNVDDVLSVQTLRNDMQLAESGGDEGSDAGVDANAESVDLTEESDLNDRLDRIDRLIRSENFNTERTHYSETVSELLAISAIQNLDLGLNLLQGDFRPANANAQNRRIIRNVSVALAASLGFFLVVTLAGGFYLNWRADSYFDKSVAIYRDIFPKQRKVIDPVRQMKRQLSGQSVGQTTSEFLPLLDAASRSLVALEEQSSIDADIKQLRYDVQRGNIAIDINAGNIDELEAYKDLLAAEGLSVDILSANQDGNVVKGRLQIGRS